MPLPDLTTFFGVPDESLCQVSSGGRAPFKEDMNLIQAKAQLDANAH